LCEQLGQSLFLAWVLVGQFFRAYSMKNFASARECTEQLQDLAARTSHEITGFFAGFTAGVLSNVSGDCVSARDYFELALKLGDQPRRELMDSNTAIALINCTGQLAASLWVLGYPEKAREQFARTLDLLDTPIDAFSRCSGIDHELIMSDFMRDNQRMLDAADRLIAVARESGITFQLGIGMIWLGRAMAAEGNVDRGIEAVAEGRGILHRHGEGEFPVLDLAEPTAYLEAGRTEEGLAIVDRLIEECAAGGVRFHEADLHRLKGELLLAAGAPMTDVEDSFRKATTIAQRQQAKSWELRASLSLARLLMKQDRRDEARTTLAEIYNRFTEGFDTADLKDAKTLLAELSA
jgi:predicted ATPase